MKRIKLLLGISTMLGILFAVGCQKMDNGANGDQLGNLVIKLTDAPFPINMVESAMVYITKVEIRKKSEGEEEGYPFSTIFEGYEEFNLLDLRNGVTADLVDVEIEPGSYDLIRLYVDEVGLKVIGGETYKLKVPSGAQTGIKIFLDPAVEVVGGLTADVLLDVNLDKSFVLKGNTKSPAGIKGFNFKPVIRAVNESYAGTVKGWVTNSDPDSDTALPYASVWIQQIIDLDTFDITLAFTNDTGYYAMPGIPAGFYTISATLEGFDTVAFDGVEVVSGNFTVQNFALTAIEEEETSSTEE